MFTNLQWILLASIFIPALTLLGLMWILRRIRSLKQERSPFSDKLLRPPGESLRREIERLDDQVNDILVATLFDSAVLVAFLMASNNGLSSVGSLGLAIIIVLAAALFALLIPGQIVKIGNRRLTCAGLHFLEIPSA